MHLATEQPEKAGRPARKLWSEEGSGRTGAVRVPERAAGVKSTGMECTGRGSGRCPGRELAAPGETASRAVEPASVSGGWQRRAPTATAPADRTASWSARSRPAWEYPAHRSSGAHSRPAPDRRRSTPPVTRNRPPRPPASADWPGPRHHLNRRSPRSAGSHAGSMSSLPQSGYGYHAERGIVSSRQCRGR